MKKLNVVVLGSTGSIGKNAVKILQNYPDKFQVAGLVARNNIALLAEQGEALKAGWIMSTDKLQQKKLHTVSPRAADGDLAELICDDAVDVVLCAIVGTAGLPLVLAALQHGKKVALASKEVLVMAGDLVMALARNGKGSIVPVDSEHSAIFQCLYQRSRNEVEKLILTASGGAFRNFTAEMIANATLEQALAHPTWNMGRKVTIDSATLMNKALEFIEAGYLFDFPADKITAVIHPQSIVHSMVEFCDGSLVAQLSNTDMRFAIGYGLSYPERLDGKSLKRLKFNELAALEFKEVERKIYPSLDFAEAALRAGGTLPAVLNAANEVAVEKFAAGKISVPQIWRTVEKTMQAHNVMRLESVETALAADGWARSFAGALNF